jgi:hypothetical protein
MAWTVFQATVTTPGTPQQLTSSVVPAFPTMSGSMSGVVLPTASVVVFQAGALNTASKNIYIGSKGMTAGTGLSLPPGVWSPPISLAEGAVSLAEIWIDADSGTLVKGLTVLVVG